MEVLVSVKSSAAKSTAPSSSLDNGDVTWTLSTVRSKFEAMAMQVLVTVGVGQQGNDIPAGHQRSLIGCLGFLLHNIITTTIFGGLTALGPQLSPSPCPEGAEAMRRGARAST